MTQKSERDLKSLNNLKIKKTHIDMTKLLASGFYIQNFKTLASLCSWAGRFEPCLVANPQRQAFSWQTSNKWNNYLFGKLFLTELVQRKEFPGQDDILNETDTGQLDTDNDLPVRHHHSDGSEVDLQILWQLLTTSIARVLPKTK